MRTLLLSVVFALTLVPAPAHAQSFFGPVFPAACKCENVQIENGSGSSPSAPAYGCVLQTLQNVIRLVFTLAFILTTLALIYAGFVWVTSGGNPGKVEQGKHLLLNTLLGLFIMLGAWLIIDFVMKTLYNQSSFGPWNDILADNSPGSACLIARNPTPITSGTISVSDAGRVGQGILSTASAVIAVGGFRLTGEAEQQARYISPAMTQLLTCVRQRIPEDVSNGSQVIVINSPAVASGRYTMQQCNSTGRSNQSVCGHKLNSCHYGGNGRCSGQSYAVDISIAGGGDATERRKITAISEATVACGGQYLNRYRDPNPPSHRNHVHVSAGRSSNCGCGI